MWVVRRFPEWSPVTLRRAWLHFAGSLPLVWVAGAATDWFVVEGPVPALAVVFLALLPALIYSCFALLCTLRLLHETSQA